MSENEYVRLELFDSETEALHVKGLLEEKGIEVRIAGQEPSALGFALDGPDAIELYVQRNDLDSANELLDQIEETEQEPVPAWTCKCGEDVDEGFYVCWSCGEEYQPPQ